MSKLSRNLKKLREGMGLSQEQMAKKVGVKRQTYGHFETYRSNPNIPLLVKFSELFNVTIDDLVKTEL